MPPTKPDFPALARALDREGVRCVVVGGIAAILHGGMHATYDSDLAVAADPENARALVRALAEFNPVPSHYPPGTGFVWDERSFHTDVVSLETSIGPLDLLRTLPGVDSFEGLWERSVTLTVSEVEVKVASLDDLLAMKREANRPKDVERILELEALRRLTEEA